MRILLLGGTADSRVIDDLLTRSGHEVVTSVAGRTSAARAGGDRVGGFGGAEGLAEYLVTERIDAVVDATHPFADRMHRNAATACATADVRLVRFERPGWRQHPHADQWTWVDSHQQAAEAAGRYDGCALLTVGRQPLAHYLALPRVVARIAEADGTVYPSGWTVLEAVGPFGLDEELALLRDTGASVLVSKDSGGGATAAKLEAAHQLGVPVVMIARPGLPDGVVEVHDPADLLTRLG